MYVQPVYAQNESANASYPELRYVLVRYGDDIGFGKNLQAAIRNAFEVPEGEDVGEDPEPTEPVDPQPSETDDPTPTDPPGDQSPQELLDQAVDDAIAAFDAAEAARQAGEFEEYARQLELAEGHLRDAAEYRDQVRDGAGAR